jgi:thymidylate synthase
MTPPSATDLLTNEPAYLALLQHVLDHGHDRPDRTGTGTRSVFAPPPLRWDLTQGRAALLLTKRVAWKTCLKELLWFLRGDTDARTLQAQGVRIWDGNTSRAFLDARGLTHYPEGDMGPGYGWQWRRFGAPYATCEGAKADGIDQVANVLDLLRTDPYSRRIFLTAWNPAALDAMALPPCHVSAQFYVDARTRGLCCHVYQRSVDCFLGLPFNLFSYGALTALLAKKAGLHPQALVISMGDAHVYRDHFDAVRAQLDRRRSAPDAAAAAPPTLTVSDAVVDLPWEDLDVAAHFDVRGYDPMPAIPAPMSA